MNRTERLLALFLLPLLCTGTVLAAGSNPEPAKKASGQPATKKSASKKPTQAAVRPTPARPPIYDPYVSGEKAIMDTARQCIESGRHLFVNFGTNSCDLCYTANEALSDPAFRDTFFKALIPVYIDVTPGTENAKLLESYGIDPAKGLPAMAVIEFSPQKATISRNGEYAAAAKKGPDAVRIFLSQFFPRPEPKSPPPVE